MELTQVTLEFRHAYNKCLSCLSVASTDKNRFAFEQRIDEILVLYSSIANISVNEAKEMLFAKHENTGVKK